MLKRCVEALKNRFHKYRKVPACFKKHYEFDPEASFPNPIFRFVKPGSQAKIG